MDFLYDEDMMMDFKNLSKDEFLEIYNFLDENDYLQTQMSINQKMEEIMNFTKIRLVNYGDMIVINIPYYKNGNFDSKISSLNNFLYLAEKHKIEIPENVRAFILNRHDRYVSSRGDDTFSIFKGENEETIDLKPYLIQIRQAVRKELENNFAIGKKRFDSVITENRKRERVR